MTDVYINGRYIGVVEDWKKFLEKMREARRRGEIPRSINFSYVDPSGEFYYTFATQDGDFLKIDLKTLEIVDRIHTGGAPEQAHS